MLISFPLQHFWEYFEMNSGPLSHLMFFGFPFSQVTFSNVLITLHADADIKTS